MVDCLMSRLICTFSVDAPAATYNPAVSRHLSGQDLKLFNTDLDLTNQFILGGFNALDSLATAFPFAVVRYSVRYGVMDL